MFALDFFIACMLGGSLSCGLSHTGVTPLDLIKCNMQAYPSKYTSLRCGFSRVTKLYGTGSLFKGWVPTLIGYSAQGALKFGFYEFFKALYVGTDCTTLGNGQKSLSHLAAASASAELIACLALCPFEALKVRVQTHPNFNIAFSQAALELVSKEGFKGLYKGLLPLWGRQIPYTVVKFVCFEKTVEELYKHMILAPKEECPKPVQLGVSFLAGYASGICCAIASHPADNIVSLINNTSGETLSDALGKMGLIALFTRGLGLRILMVGTQTGAQWGMYDAFKVFTGLPTSGLVARKQEEQRSRFSLRSNSSNLRH